MSAVHVLHGIGVQLATGGQAGFAAGIETGAIGVQVAARLELDVLGVDARRGCLQSRSVCSVVVVCLLSQLPLFLTVSVCAPRHRWRP
ncbi:hypothetical protein [Zoogloea sp.]|uniref:hypothetical protein n=1 Tax=Zoogloea sp. TaxID=49181 RepID=UPI0025E57C6E|nr:hypothetical protein [Zoogloea sp.]